MRALLASAVVLLTLTVPVGGQQPRRTYQQITVADTAIGISASTLSGMAQCSLRLEQAQIRWRHDGTVPTTSIGTLLEIGDVLSFADVRDAAAWRGIRTGGTSGIINVWCEAR